MADHYVKRRPTMVKDACEAIWRYYGETIGKALEKNSPPTAAVPKIRT